MGDCLTGLFGLLVVLLPILIITVLLLGWLFGLPIFFTLAKYGTAALIVSVVLLLLKSVIFGDD